MMFSLAAASLLAVISTLMGYGWTLNGKFNPIGAVVNILGCLVISGFVLLLKKERS